MKYITTALLSLACSVAFSQTEPDVAPPPQRGVYAIWYYDDQSLLEIPYVSGGQIVLQWADVEPQQGKYDFSKLDNQLKQMFSLGKMTTIQINGNNKPKWMYKVIPHHPEKFSTQIQDEEGSLMYWHPAFINAYINLIKAYGDHLRKSPYLKVMAGVRMNFDALGTEHFPIPKDKTALNQWVVPPGVEQGKEWTDQISEDYQNTIAKEFIKDFSGIKLLLRNNIKPEIVNKYRKDFDEGRLMLFHTSSEMEPRGKTLEYNYHLFYEFVRSGKTLAYAEPWADAWGNHGGKTDPRWTGPSQWTYWRMLSDLNCGVSMPAVYTNDLKVARSGFQGKMGKEVKQYQEEFSKAYKFAAFYAGYHASPSVSPGAWVAFRHTTKNLMTKSDLAEFTGNYTFLMKQVTHDEGNTKDAINIGDDSQRFGAWSKVVGEGKNLGVGLSDIFSSSLKGKPSVVRIIYFDGKSGSFEVSFSGQNVKTQLGGTNKWKTLEFPLTASNFSKDAAGSQINLHVLSGEVAFHMMNVECGTGLPANVSEVKAVRQGSDLKLSWKAPLDYDIQSVGVFVGGELFKTVPVTESSMVLLGLSDVQVAGAQIKTIDEAGRASSGVLIKK